MWANTRSLTLNVDVHRPSSCNTDGPILTINWAPLDRSKQDSGGIGGGFPFTGEMDGVVYNHLTATYDTTAGQESYECGSSDWLMSINAAEALSCRELLVGACERVQDGVCPCYSLSDLVLLEHSIRENEIVLNEELSCVEPMVVEPMADNTEYGLFEIRSGVNNGWEYDNSTFPLFSTDSMSTCYGAGDAGNNNKTIDHCRKLMQDSCEALSKSESKSFDYAFEPQCRDDFDFGFKGKQWKTCDWVASDPDERCKKRDRQTGLFVFEGCRSTCGKCACEDDDTFRVNAEESQNCAWVREGPDTRCKMGGAADHCLSVCSSECCQDNPDFKMGGNTGCDWVDEYGSMTAKGYKKRNKRCRRQHIARNCPQTCGKCPGVRIF